jgi:hypothetical protein
MCIVLFSPAPLGPFYQFFASLRRLVKKVIFASARITLQRIVED